MNDAAKKKIDDAVAALSKRGAIADAIHINPSSTFGIHATAIVHGDVTLSVVFDASVEVDRIRASGFARLHEEQ